MTDRALDAATNWLALHPRCTCALLCIRGFEMSKINDGGLAFPGVRTEQVGTVADHGIFDDDSPTFAEVSHPGMTLRDWFAGKALGAIIQADGIQYAKDTEPHAIWAYEQADAMLAARERV